MTILLSKKWKKYKTVFHSTSKINCMVHSLFKPFFATASSDSVICLWDSKKYRKISNFKAHQGSITKIIFDEKSGNLISSGENTHIFSWDPEYEKVVRVFRGHRSSVNCLSVHPVLNLLVSGGRDNTIRIWDLRIKKEISVIHYHKNQVTSVNFNQESPHLISSGKDSMICLWDMVAFKSINNLILHPSGIKDIKLHPTELNFASLCSDLLILWRLDGMVFKTLKVFKNINLFSFVNIDEFVVVDYSGLIKLYKGKKWGNFSNFQYSIHPLSSKSYITPTSLCFNADYTGLMVGNKIGEIVIYKNKWSIYD